MKKTLAIIAGCLIAATSAFAQEKGEMAIGGTLGFSGGTSNSQSIVHINGERNASKMSKNPHGSFTIGPEFSYFVIDNLQLNTGFRYDMSSWKGSGSDHKYMFGIGLNYFVKITDRFYYAPGFYYDFGGSTYSNDDYSKSGFATGIELQLGKFEVRVSKHFGLDLTILNLDYDYVGTHNKSEELDTKIRIANHDLDFRLGSHIGFKYYF